MHLHLIVVDYAHMLSSGPLGLYNVHFHLKPLKSLKYDLLHLKYIKLIFYTSRKVIRYSNYSNNIFFTYIVPYTLQYLKLDLLHLKRGLKILKSLK